MLTGPVELQQAELRISTRGTTLMHAKDSLQAVAREHARLVLIPRGGSELQPGL